MQFVNRHISGRNRNGQAQRQEIGHIDLMSHYCFIEVPDNDAANVMAALDGTTYHGRQVRCNAEGSGKPEQTESNSERRGGRRDMRKPRQQRPARRNERQREFSADDWRALMSAKNIELRGDEPDFSEEGWARRKKKKK